MTKAQLKNPIVEQNEVNSMAKHDFVFQFIDHSNGYRSEPFLSNWTELGKILDDRAEDQKPTNEDYILLVAVMDGKQTHIPNSPLITVETYLDKVRPSISTETEQ